MAPRTPEAEVTARSQVCPGASGGGPASPEKRDGNSAGDGNRGKGDRTGPSNRDRTSPADSTSSSARPGPGKRTRPY